MTGYTEDSIADTGLYKSAVLLISLGSEAASRVLSHLDDLHVEALIREMSRLGKVRAAERDRVLDEFQQRVEESVGSAIGGIDTARRMLEQAVGPEKALRILNGAVLDEPPPSLAKILEDTSPQSLAALVADEHPQVIALLMEQLSVEQAAVFLTALPAEAQGPVAARLAEMEAPAPIALDHLERCLQDKLRGEPETPTEDRTAGPRRVAEILGRMRRSVESLVLSSLEQQSPEVAQKVQQYRFTFEDLLQLDGRSLQRILREVESETLRLAMKGLDEEQQETIFANMSERASARLKEELETASPIRLRDVEAAQSAMLAVARALQEAGEVQLPIGGSGDGEEEDVIV
jgi:flagellar motor switch protein FliG